MAHGCPDYVTIVQVVVTVNNVPIVPEPATEVAAGNTGRLTTILEAYQEVTKWTVSDNKVGELKEITVLSTEYEKTYLQITIGSVTYETDWLAQGAIPLIFADLKLAAASVVKVEAKSTDGNSITVDAVIVGKEIG